jgi:nucleoside-diphosphate-sugar epimerase
VKLLFVGGTGVISPACVELAVARGHEVWLLNRGRTRPPVDPPAGVHHLVADVGDPAAVRAATAGLGFDAVVQFVGFTPDQVAKDIAQFRAAGQYVFISSATVYRKPPARHLITEETPLGNPFWPYAQNKIACEDMLWAAHADGFPMTIVRPSLTYGLTQIPLCVSSWTRPYTVVDRMRRGRPVIVSGDGTWNDIYAEVAAAAGVAADLVHVPADALAAADPEALGGLFGDKIHSLVFDNAKIRSLVPDFTAPTPFSSGVRQSLAWFDADPARQLIDDEANTRWDRVIDVYADALRRVTAGA